jgi:hypothetical protein
MMAASELGSMLPCVIFQDTWEDILVIIVKQFDSVSC